MKRSLILASLISILFVFLCSFSYSEISADETVCYGGYCYYIENGDIYRAPMTILSGETALFRENSSKIMLSGSDLLSFDDMGNITSYSLVSDDETVLKDELHFLSNMQDEGLLIGSLSAKYESNGNPGAISSGKGDAGGVSFGAYQFAGNAGVPYAFSLWCSSKEEYAAIGNRLIEAYSADSNTYGDNFKACWKAIASEDRELFHAIQHSYVKEKYYDAIVHRIESNVENFDIDMYGIALKNVFWSRSVQHGVGGSYNVITRAFDSIGGFSLQSEDILIRAIYAESGAVSDTGTNPMTGATAEEYGIAGKYMKYYSKNSSSVQLSVFRRLNINELSEALMMLDTYGGYTASEDTPYLLGGLRTADITDAQAHLFGTVYNYRLQNVSEYGFLIGKNTSEFKRIQVSSEGSSVPVISFNASTLSYSNELDPMTTYYFAVYAVINGEYAESDVSYFVSGFAQTYTAFFKNYDGTLLYSQTLREGRLPKFIGKKPTRPSDEKYTYTFIGWDKEILPLTEDTVYTAIYDGTKNKYKVRYFSNERELIFECEVEYGGQAVFYGVLPTKSPDRQFGYAFSHWSQSEDNITMDTDLFPMFIKRDLLWSGKSSSGFAQGNGSREFPFEISSPEELAYLSEYTAAGNSNEKYFVLTQNIVLSTGDNKKYFTPIGNSENPFCGNLDGKGYKIEGLCVYSNDAGGLFGFVNGSTIKNLIIEDADIRGNIAGMITGEIICDSGNVSTVDSCMISGTVNGSKYAGLAFGKISGDNVFISNISAAGSLLGEICGGICGSFAGSSLSSAVAFIDNISDSGDGIVGRCSTQTAIESCYFYGSATSSFGEQLSQFDLNLESSYSGFDFFDTWIISEGKAQLKIASENDFSYLIYGDADENGKLNTKDIILIAQYLAEWDVRIGYDFFTRADVNLSGRINTADIVLIAQFIAGWDVSLGTK